ncbi:hypothetical protein [Lactiplantibacillus plantarum]|uniref:hypothetical protein n=1 Tax=Lactiplantibacillus plantarum TaxID=1590 RepID=UPI001BACE880|nr:hypothetical protein [Lactiplantibacillus plantarum]MBS0943818.1 hypothetical protein [Lactiplantibacillus plantarum]
MSSHSVLEMKHKIENEIELINKAKQLIEAVLAEKVILKKNNGLVQSWRMRTKSLIKKRQEQQSDNEITIERLNNMKWPPMAYKVKTKRGAEILLERYQAALDQIQQAELALENLSAVNRSEIVGQLEIRWKLIIKNQQAVQEYLGQISSSDIQSDLNRLNELAPVFELSQEESGLHISVNVSNVRTILKRFESNENDISNPFNGLSNWIDEYATDESFLPADEWTDQVVNDLQNYLDKHNFSLHSEIEPFKTKWLSRVGKLRGKEILPNSVASEMLMYATDEYDNTIANVGQINDLANEYDLLPIELKKESNDATKRLINVVIELSNITIYFGRQTQQTARFKMATNQLLQIENKGLLASTNACDQFVSASNILTKWFDEKWYQFGGNPEGDTAYGGKGNAYVFKL